MFFNLSFSLSNWNLSAQAVVLQIQISRKRVKARWTEDENQQFYKENETFCSNLLPFTFLSPERIS